MTITRYIELLIYLVLTISLPNCTTTKEVNKSSISKSMTQEDYLEKGRHIWKKYVPDSGQADYVQGELLRAVEKLRDEAQRNGNINFNNSCHTILIKYLRDKLDDKDIFNDTTIDQINNYLTILNRANQPYLKDDIYDYITHRIIDWYVFYGDEIKHKKNAKLRC